MIQFTLNQDTPRLGRLINRVQNFAPAMSEIATYLEREHKLYFAKQAGPDGAWAGLSANTLRYKKSGAILRETSALVSSISSESDSHNAKVKSSGVVYGIYHQTGTSKMPQRRFIGFAPHHPAKCVEIVEDYLL